MAGYKSWEPSVSEPQLPSAWRTAENFLLSSLELFHVRGGEDNPVLEKLGFRGRNPDEEVGGERDCEKKENGD